MTTINDLQDATSEEFSAEQELVQDSGSSLFDILFRMLILAVFFSSLPIVLVLGSYGYFQITETIVPGVWVRDIDLSGMNMDQAAEILHENWNLEHTIMLVDSLDTSQTWDMDNAMFGLTLDSTATAQATYRIGHHENIALSVFETISTYRKGVSLTPIVSMDDVLILENLQAIAESAYVPVTEGYIRIEALTVEAANGQTGKELDLITTLEALSHNPLSVLESGILPLIMVPIQPAIPDVSESTRALQSLLDTHWIVQVYDPVINETYTWEPTEEERAAWMDITTHADHITSSYNEAAYQADLQEWAAQFGEERTIDETSLRTAASTSLEQGTTAVLQLSYLPTTREVGSGETLSYISSQVGIPTWKILEYNPELSGSGLVYASTITIPPRDINLEKPVVMGKRIRISISEQHMWVYHHDEVIDEFVVSTGMDNSPTMPGLFQVLFHELNAYGSRWDLYMPHFLGIYEALPDFTNGIHGLPLLSNGQRLWGNVLGTPASYGCIILELDSAEWLYDWAEDGVVVEIER